MKKVEEVLTEKNKSLYELIITVVANGFSDYVVSSARDAGATGATILTGRGTSISDKMVMGMVLQTERDIVMILVKKSDRRKVMQAIADSTSLLEEGRGLCFSVPVSNVYGVKRVAEQKKEQIQKAKMLQKSTKSNKQSKN